ncbi:MAG: hypothetical protein JWQ73_1690, partial [Variovorax sp.]|nr:hypothetical protein [Variovorax sp.]
TRHEVDLETVPAPDSPDRRTCGWPHELRQHGAGLAGCVPQRRREPAACANAVRRELRMQ